MNFKNAFLGPRSIQVCHLRSKTPLTSIDCLRGPPRRIQRGHKSPRMPPPPAPPSLQQPPAPPCLQRRRPLHATREATPCVPLRAAGRLAARRCTPAQPPSGRRSSPARPGQLASPLPCLRGPCAHATGPPLLVPLCAPLWPPARSPAARLRARPRCHPRLACARPPSSLHAVFTPPSMPRPRI